MNSMPGPSAAYKDQVHRRLEELYSSYHKREFIAPDPLEFLARYPDQEEREIAGLIVSALSLGRVCSILQAADTVLGRFTALKEQLLSATRADLLRMFENFSYRFFRGHHLASFLCGIKGVLQRYGSLEACFNAGMSSGDETVLPALCKFTSAIRREAGGPTHILVTSPEKKSACKRHLLYLRWMVRKDEIDPGGWDSVSPSRLVVPVDTHMLRMSTLLGLTRRKQADITAALEITERLKCYDPEDPVRYDFSMTRPGINPHLEC
jgi:uncharacterized protein (TIGR02757 family)